MSVFDHIWYNYSGECPRQLIDIQPIMSDNDPRGIRPIYEDFYGEPYITDVSNLEVVPINSIKVNQRKKEMARRNPNWDLRLRLRVGLYHPDNYPGLPVSTYLWKRK